MWRVSLSAVDSADDPTPGLVLSDDGGVASLVFRCPQNPKPDVAGALNILKLLTDPEVTLTEEIRDALTVVLATAGQVAARDKKAAETTVTEKKQQVITTNSSNLPETLVQNDEKAPKPETPPSKPMRRARGSRKRLQRSSAGHHPAKKAAVPVIPHENACPVCQGPGHRGRYDKSNHCQTCYNGLYNDAKKVTQALLKQGKMLNISFDIQEDLRCFTEELKKTVRVCRTNFNCPPSAYLHSVPVRERCQRCRTLATLKILPDFAHNILKTVVGAIQQDVKETQMYTAPATPQQTSTLQQAAQQVAQQAATQQALLNGLTSTSSAFFPPYQGVGSSFGSYMHMPYLPMMMMPGLTARIPKSEEPTTSK